MLLAESSRRDSPNLQSLNVRFRKKQTLKGVKILVAEKSTDERPVYTRKQPFA